VIFPIDKPENENAGRTSVTVACRPSVEGDQQHLFDVYCSTREEELAIVPWNTAQKDEFLRFQFAAREHHYNKFYPDAISLIVLVNEQPAGRLLVHRGEREIRIVDIAMNPLFRGCGIGGRLLEEILDEARQSQKKVTIHVEKHNRALNLYLRMGFRPVDDKDVYWLMEWDGERATDLKTGSAVQATQTGNAMDLARGILADARKPIEQSCGQH
jgi:ribosomal protein S18 acetylase RimI-like enzyme